MLQFFTSTTFSKPDRPVLRNRAFVWLSLSLLVATLYAIWGQYPLFIHEFTVQDDARQHVFWMARFLNPDLFPGDLIADYYQSVAPVGYSGIYRLAAMLGIPPLLFNKLLPFLLIWLTTGFGFGVCLQILPLPLAGFASMVLLNQNLWLYDDIASGTARAFLYPIFLAFLYFLLRRQLLPCLLAIALQGIFYPQFIFIMSGVLALGLVTWEKGLRWSRNRRDYWFAGTGLLVAFLVLLPFAIGVSDYGPLITVEQARQWPEFVYDDAGNHGRTNFFTDDPITFWLTGRRSGALIWVMPLSIASVILMPLVLRWRDRLPLAQKLQNLDMFVQVGLTSLGMFLAAHLLLFRLYLPARYMHFTLQILTALAGGIAVTILVHALLPSATRVRQSWWRMGLAGFLALVLFLSPILYHFPKEAYVQGGAASAYRFFARQPEDILIAGISPEVDNIPIFAQRSVLTGREYSVPYQTGYYQQIRQRTIDLIRAQYSPDVANVQGFIQQYGVDFWFIDRKYLQSTRADARSFRSMNNWLNQFQPWIAEAQARLDAGEAPALMGLIDTCASGQTNRFAILPADCLLAQQNSNTGNVSP
jgi:hypothetical protein